MPFSPILDIEEFKQQEDYDYAMSTQTTGRLMNNRPEDDRKEKSTLNLILCSNGSTSPDFAKDKNNFQ